MTAARTLLIDRKDIGLCLLQKACWEDLNLTRSCTGLIAIGFGTKLFPSIPKTNKQIAYSVITSTTVSRN